MNEHADSEKIHNQNQIISDQNTKLEQQQDELDRLRTQIEAERLDLPLLKVTSEILMIPLVGTLDSTASKQILNDVLINIKEQETRVVVIDIAGIRAVDTAVTSYLIKIAKATMLMGCQSIISGISPLIATNIVDLGVETQGLITTNTLEDAMSKAYELSGYELLNRNHERHPNKFLSE